MSESDGVKGLDAQILNALIKRCLCKQFQLEHIQLTPFFLTTIALSQLLRLNSLLPLSSLNSAAVFLSFPQSCSDVWCSPRTQTGEHLSSPACVYRLPCTKETTFNPDKRRLLSTLGGHRTLFKSHCFYYWGNLIPYVVCFIFFCSLWIIYSWFVPGAQKTRLKINITKFKVKLCFDPLNQKEEERLVLITLTEQNWLTSSRCPVANQEQAPSDEQIAAVFDYNSVFPS